MSSPELWVVALLRWLLLCALAGAIGGIAGRALARGQAGPGPAPLPDPWALIAKAALVAVAASLAVAGRIWLHRNPGLAPAPGGPRPGPALATKLEVGTLAVVLAVTAVLTLLTPPQSAIRPLSSQHTTSRR